MIQTRHQIRHPISYPAGHRHHSFDTAIDLEHVMVESEVVLDYTHWHFWSRCGYSYIIPLGHPYDT